MSLMAAKINRKHFIKITTETTTCMYYLKTQVPALEQITQACSLKPSYDAH